MKIWLIFALLITPPLMAEDDVDDIPLCDEEAEVCEYQTRGCSKCRPNHYWYLDLNYDYSPERDQQAYWPGKNESYFYDFLAK